MDEEEEEREAQQEREEQARIYQQALERHRNEILQAYETSTGLDMTLIVGGGARWARLTKLMTDRPILSFNHSIELLNEVLKKLEDDQQRDITAGFLYELHTNTNTLDIPPLTETNCLHIRRELRALAWKMCERGQVTTAFEIAAIELHHLFGEALYGGALFEGILEWVYNELLVLSTKKRAWSEEELQKNPLLMLDHTARVTIEYLKYHRRIRDVWSLLESTRSQMKAEMDSLQAEWDAKNKNEDKNEDCNNGPKRKRKRIYTDEQMRKARKTSRKLMVWSELMNVSYSLAAYLTYNMSVLTLCSWGPQMFLHLIPLTDILCHAYPEIHTVVFDDDEVCQTVSGTPTLPMGQAESLWDAVGLQGHNHLLLKGTEEFAAELFDAGRWYQYFYFQATVKRWWVGQILTSGQVTRLSLWLQWRSLLDCDYESMVKIKHAMSKVPFPLDPNRAAAVAAAKRAQARQEEIDADDDDDDDPLETDSDRALLQRPPVMFDVRGAPVNVLKHDLMFTSPDQTLYSYNPMTYIYTRDSPYVALLLPYLLRLAAARPIAQPLSKADGDMHGYNYPILQNLLEDMRLFVNIPKAVGHMWMHVFLLCARFVTMWTRNRWETDDPRPECNGRICTKRVLAFNTNFMEVPMTNMGGAQAWFESVFCREEMHMINNIMTQNVNTMKQRPGFTTPKAYHPKFTARRHCGVLLHFCRLIMSGRLKGLIAPEKFPHPVRQFDQHSLIAPNTRRKNPMNLRACVGAQIEESSNFFTLTVGAQWAKDTGRLGPYKLKHLCRESLAKEWDEGLAPQGPDVTFYDFLKGKMEFIAHQYGGGHTIFPDLFLRTEYLEPVPLSELVMAQARVKKMYDRMSRKSWYERGIRERPPRVPISYWYNCWLPENVPNNNWTETVRADYNRVQEEQHVTDIFVPLVNPDKVSDLPTGASAVHGYLSWDPAMVTRGLIKPKGPARWKLLHIHNKSVYTSAESKKAEQTPLLASRRYIVAEYYSEDCTPAATLDTIMYDNCGRIPFTLSDHSRSASEWCGLRSPPPLDPEDDLRITEYPEPECYTKFRIPPRGPRAMTESLHKRVFFHLDRGSDPPAKTLIRECVQPIQPTQTNEHPLVKGILKGLINLVGPHHRPVPPPEDSEDEPEDNNMLAAAAMDDDSDDSMPYVPVRRQPRSGLQIDV